MIQLGWVDLESRVSTTKNSLVEFAHFLILWNLLMILDLLVLDDRGRLHLFPILLLLFRICLWNLCVEVVLICAIGIALSLKYFQ